MGKWIKMIVVREDRQAEDERVWGNKATHKPHKNKLKRNGNRRRESGRGREEREREGNASDALKVFNFYDFIRNAWWTMMITRTRTHTHTLTHTHIRRTDSRSCCRTTTTTNSSTTTRTMYTTERLQAHKVTAKRKKSWEREGVRWRDERKIEEEGERGGGREEESSFPSSCWEPAQGGSQGVEGSEAAGKLLHKLYEWVSFKWPNVRERKREVESGRSRESVSERGRVANAMSVWL